MTFNTFKKGFTLVEVLGAIFILSLLISISSQISYGNFNRMKKARILEDITYLLEFKMSELESKYKNHSISLLQPEEEGAFDSYPGYSWKYITKPLELPDSLVLLSMQNLEQNDANIQVINIIKDILSKSVVELKLVVTHTKGKKLTEYSLTTYFINYPVVPEELKLTISQLIPGILNLEGSEAL